MAIDIQGLHKSYGDNQVLRGFSCTLEEGKTTCLMGPSGVGKTTLINILLGLERPDSGTIGQLAGMRLSAVFQEDRLCENIGAAANVQLVTGKAVPKLQIEQALAAVGLTDCTQQPVRELSGGMRRRVAIVRALLASYDVLLLDEPFKGLDKDTKAQTIAYVKAQSAGKTVLMITHDAAEAAAMGGCVVEMRG